MREHTAPPGAQGMALSAYLARAYPAIPGALLRGLFKKREVRMDGVRCAGDVPVRAGARICLYAPDALLSPPLPVVFSDGFLAVVDKPAGLPMDVDSRGIGQDTLLSRAQSAFDRVYLCHRLDTHTSGALVVALCEEGYQALTQAFSGRQVEKWYQCLVLGRPSPPSGRLFAYLAKDGRRARVRVSDAPFPGAREILTEYRTLDAGGEVSRLVAMPLTGRTHQIRAHLAHIGHPILGDDVYGDRAFNKRQGVYKYRLHSAQIALPEKGPLARYRGRVFSVPAPF